MLGGEILMSNYILTSDGELYHCDSTGNELYHYGIRGMKWGIRRKLDTVSARQAIRNAKVAKLQAKRDAIDNGHASRIGERFRINGAGIRAFGKSISADRSHNARERAKGWVEMSDRAQNKGKLRKSEKYLKKAVRESSAAARIDLMSKLGDEAMYIAAKYGKVAAKKSVEVLASAGKKVTKTLADRGRKALDRSAERKTPEPRSRIENDRRK